MSRAPTELTGYDRRIGRYGRELGDALIDVAGVAPGNRVLDVGCGTGALTERLVARLGSDLVAAVDPSPDDVARCRERLPGVDVRVARGEELPYANAEFDAVLAQLVVSHFDDPTAGVAEMVRVARPGGPIATAVWDFGGGMTALRAFWDAAAAVRAPGTESADQAQSHRFTTAESLDELWRAGGLTDVSTGALMAGTEYADIDDLWEPLAMPDGSPGRFLERLDAATVQRIREELRALGPPPPPSGSRRGPSTRLAARHTRRPDGLDREVVYLDYNATTLVDPAIVHAMLPHQAAELRQPLELPIATARHRRPPSTTRG